jgi:hypothetical protein
MPEMVSRKVKEWIGAVETSLSAQERLAGLQAGQAPRFMLRLKILYFVASGTISTLETVMAPFSSLPFRVT